MRPKAYRHEKRKNPRLTGSRRSSVYLCLDEWTASRRKEAPCCTLSSFGTKEHKLGSLKVHTDRKSLLSMIFSVYSSQGRPARERFQVSKACTQTLSTIYYILSNLRAGSWHDDFQYSDASQLVTRAQARVMDVIRAGGVLRRCWSWCWCARPRSPWMRTSGSRLPALGRDPSGRSWRYIFHWRSLETIQLSILLSHLEFLWLIREDVLPESSLLLHRLTKVYCTRLLQT
jgi:hypothetical protein